MSTILHRDKEISAEYDEHYYSAKTQHLVVFQEVIKSGSIGSAARQLGLTQPAVSKIINDIETYFGVELIVRKNTGVKLTSAGQPCWRTPSPSPAK